MSIQPTRPRSFVDVVAYYNAAMSLNIARKIERDRFLAAARALRSEGYSVRHIAALLGTSYGTVTRALTYRLPAGYAMHGWTVPPDIPDALPDGLYASLYRFFDKTTWRHSPDVLAHFPRHFRGGEYSATVYAQEHGLNFECQPEREVSIMADIVAPEHHLRSPVAVTAQGVASALGYTMDTAGHIYDQHGIWIARDLEQLAAALVKLAWIAPRGAGVAWSEFQEAGGISREGVDDEVRKAVAAIERKQS